MIMFYVRRDHSGDRVCFRDNSGIEWGVPENPANSDYQRYLEWLAEGNEPEVVEL